jgi:AraC-like DNA-binding protein
MRYQHYHLALDMEPTWISSHGFAMEKLVLEWQQPTGSWQFMIVMYRGILSVNGTPIPFEPGSALLIPPGARCGLTRLDGDDISHFWYKFKPNPEAVVTRSISQVKALGSSAEYVQNQCREALDTMLVSTRRNFVWIWHLLWSLSEEAATSPEDVTTAEIQAFIDENLSNPALNQMLNDLLDRSERQVARLFHDHFNQPPAAYVRSRRMHKACELLLTTEASIKEVAVSVGILDLHRFNKLIRDAFGCSPRTLRADQRNITINVDAATEQHRQKALEVAEKRV